MRENGFVVTTTDRTDMPEVKKQYGVPDAAKSCHTALVNGYVVEGHVPAEDLKRFLKEKPEVAGLAVGGMPLGSPGMEGANPVPFDSVTFTKDGQVKVYNTHKPTPKPSSH